MRPGTRTGCDTDRRHFALDRGSTGGTLQPSWLYSRLKLGLIRLIGQEISPKAIKKGLNYSLYELVSQLVDIRVLALKMAGQ